jgi:uncharacterized protein
MSNWLVPFMFSRPYHEAVSKRFGILSLSGGGFFGLYTAAILARLEQEAGVPLARCFDLIAGTSIGGLIALALAHEIPANKIQEAIESNGPTIFSRRPAPSGVAALFDLSRSFFRPKYRADALRTTISNLVGADTRLRDLKHRGIIPSVNLTKGSPQIFKTSHHASFKVDRDRLLVDVALAASAAPTYFPIAEIGDALYADGGLFAGSPDLIALHEATHFLSQKEADVHVLSVGTTTAKYSFAHANGTGLGIIGWAWRQRLVSVLMASQQQAVHEMMKHRLGNRYLRLDSEQSREQNQRLALDVATADAQKTIRGLASATLQSFISDARIQEFIAHKAAPPTFTLGLSNCVSCSLPIL